MRRFVLVDVDHTISNAFPRDGMDRDARTGTSTWDEYHQASVNDEPLHDMIDLVNTLHAAGYTIIGLSARPERYRRITMDWFVKHRVNFDELLLRADEAFRPSPEMKMTLALERFKDIKNEVAFLIEDRDDVCQAFKDLGITVLQCHARRD